MIYALVGIASQGSTPVDHDDDNHGDGSDIGSVGGPFKKMKRIPLALNVTGIVDIKMVAPQDLNAVSIATETVFSTTTIHVKLTTSSPSPVMTMMMTTTFPSSTRDSNDDTPSSTIDSTTVDNSADVMTGEMFCPATDRPNDVYTPCPYTHTNQPQMVDATALPGVVVTSSGRSRVYNPYSVVLQALPKLIEANKELIWRSKQLAKYLLGAARNIASDVLHRDIDVWSIEHQPCTAGGNRAERLAARVEDLEKKNQRLREGIYNARDVMGVQQDLLDSHMRVIEKQRIQIEEVTRSMFWWASTRNGTGSRRYI